MAEQRLSFSPPGTRGAGIRFVTILLLVGMAIAGSGCSEKKLASNDDTSLIINLVGSEFTVAPGMESVGVAACIHDDSVNTRFHISGSQVDFDSETCTFPPPILVLPDETLTHISAPHFMQLAFPASLQVVETSNQTHRTYSFMMPSHPITFQYDVQEAAEQLGLVFVAIPESQSALANNTLYVGHFHSNLLAKDFATNIGYQCKNTLDFADCIVPPPFEPDLFLVNGRTAPAIIDSTQPLLIVNHGVRTIQPTAGTGSATSIAPGMHAVIPAEKNPRDIIDVDAPKSTWWGPLTAAKITSHSQLTETSWPGELLPNIPAAQVEFVEGSSETLNPKSYEFQIELPYSCALKSIDLRIIPDRPGGTANLDAYNIQVTDQGGRILKSETIKRGDPWIYEWTPPERDPNQVPSTWTLREKGEGGQGFTGSWTALYETRWDVIFNDPPWFDCLMTQVIESGPN